MIERIRCTLKLFTGDNVEVMRREIPDASIQLTVTSPPYDNLRKYNGFTWDFEAVARELYRVTKPGGVVVWVVADATVNGSETGTSFRQALYFKECGFNLHDTMVYQKLTYPPQNHNRYEQCWEYMFVFSKGRPSVFTPVHIPCPTAGTPRKMSNRHNKEECPVRIRDEVIITKATKPDINVWAMYPSMCGVNHPAIFPEDLAGKHILSWSNPGDTVLDPFVGSGTTGKMAVLNGREFIGIDISQEYVDLATGRINAALRRGECQSAVQPGLFG